MSTAAQPSIPRCSSENDRPTLLSQEHGGWDERGDHWAARPLIGFITGDNAPQTIPVPISGRDLRPFVQP
jgi:hypothetical protein